MNPIANTPIFLGLTANDTPDERKRVARKALMLAFGLVVVFALLGKLIFSLFGITLPAFQITGGVLVALIGYGFFISGERLMSVLGQNGLNVITRIMGLILAVIGVQMLITGVYGAIKMY